MRSMEPGLDKSRHIGSVGAIVSSMRAVVCSIGAIVSSMGAVVDSMEAIVSPMGAFVGLMRAVVGSIFVGIICAGGWLDNADSQVHERRQGRQE
jgi:hypothetical protein